MRNQGHGVIMVLSWSALRSGVMADCLPDQSPDAFVKSLKSGCILGDSRVFQSLVSQFTMCHTLFKSPLLRTCILKVVHLPEKLRYVYVVSRQPLYVYNSRFDFNRSCS